VERLVGMVKSINGAAVPGAPLKRVKSKSRRELGDAEFLGHSDVRSTGQPTSPLVIISDRRRLGQGYFKPVMSPTKLTMLQEEEEDSYDEAEKHAARLVFHSGVRTSVDEDVFCAAKKRRSSVLPAEIDMTTPTMCHIKLLTGICDDINDVRPVSETSPCVGSYSMTALLLSHFCLARSLSRLPLSTDPSRILALGIVRPPNSLMLKMHLRVIYLMVPCVHLHQSSPEWNIKAEFLL